MEDLDPIKFEVIRNALTTATEEMALTLRRAAYSTNIKTRADFSCAFFDADLRSVAQSFAQPNHLGSLVELVPRMVREYGPERLAPGDGILSNDPYGGGVHLNDMTLVAPVYQGHELFGFIANLAHHVDVGGGAPASIGAFKEVYQEGVIVPPVKLVEAGSLLDDVFRLVLAQIRSKHETAGDFRAQVAANVTGARRIGALLERFGLETMRTYVDALIDYTERRARAEQRNLPHGTFRAEGWVDNDGYTDEPVKLVAAITVDDAGVLFDFTGSDPQRRAPVNATYAQTYSACAYALKCLIDPDVPTNAGFYRLVRVVAPEGTVVNSLAPGPVVGGWETNNRLTEVIFRALAPALPERMPAGTKGMICHSGFGGIKPDGDYFCFLETMGGGYGGRAHSDGPDAVQTHGQNTENAPIEETELNYPVRISRYCLVDDSEGAGEFRGGLGLHRDYHFPDQEVTFTILSDRDREGPAGLFGGLSGSVSQYILNPSGENKRLSSKTTLELKPGDTVSYRTSGGGGYGPPHRRDPRRVLRDVRDGKVSLQRARDVYGVAIHATTWTVNEYETKRLRNEQ
jgi:N-methylhydantoinase B